MDGVRIVELAWRERRERKGLPVRCKAQIHAHIDGRCYGVLAQCAKEDGHHMKGWHKTEDGSVRFDYDDRTNPPHEGKDEK